MATAAIFSCSRCDHPNPSGRPGPAGSCSTCPDGEGAALCEKCFARHRDRYKDHEFTAATEPAPGADLLSRLGLAPVATVCVKHGDLPYTGLVCSECSAGSDRGLCIECVKLHSAAFPTHLLAPSAPEAASLRAKLAAASSGQGPSEARRKALSAQAQLDALISSVEGALVQLEANRDSAFAEVTARFEAVACEVQAAARSKRSMLEDDVRAADAARDAVDEIVGALKEAARVLSDADVSTHASELLARATAAVSAVDAVAARSDAFAEVRVSVPSSDTLRAAIEAAIGTIAPDAAPAPPSPPLSPLEETPPLLFDEASAVGATLSNGGITVTNDGTGRTIAVATRGFSSGRSSWEFKLDADKRDDEGTCVGATTRPIANRDYDSGAHYVYRAFNGELFGPGRVGEKKRTKYHPGDIIACVFDADDGTLAFSVNGVSQGVCYNGLAGKTLFPAVCLYHGKAGTASVSLVRSGVPVPLPLQAVPAVPVANVWRFDGTLAMGVVLSDGNATVSHDCKGHAIVATTAGFSSGRSSWEFKLDVDKRDDEGTCVGATTLPLVNHDYYSGGKLEMAPAQSAAAGSSHSD